MLKHHNGPVEPRLRAGGQAAAISLELELTLERILGRLLPRGTRAALINYPNHHNVGDPALYLGTIRVLRRLGVQMTYRCQHRTYSRDSLARELSRGTNVILINGGGNLGDQYPQQQARERVLADFPDVPTIQLPQSIWFANHVNLGNFATVVSRHQNLTLLLRDQASYEAARRYFDAPSTLCPDLAFGLGPLPRPLLASQDVVWLRRNDRESADPEAPRRTLDGVESIDWLDASPEEAVGGGFGVWLLHINRRLTENVGRVPSLWHPLARTFDPLAGRRLAYGCRLLARGRTVVTDRLHGVVLALLMGIPVVAVDNRKHKVGNFVATWLRDTPDVQLASSHDEALCMARDLLGAIPFTAAARSPGT
ncbi:MAG: polysaccharide pyruvyl transferase family protein [Aeromicrobium sp.]